MIEHGGLGKMSLKKTTVPLLWEQVTCQIVRVPTPTLSSWITDCSSRAAEHCCGDQRHQTNVPKLLLEGSMPGQLQCQWFWQCLLSISSTKSGWKVFTPRKKEIKLQQIKNQPANDERSRDHCFNNSTFVSLPFLEVLKTTISLISSRSSCT